MTGLVQGGSIGPELRLLRLQGLGFSRATSACSAGGGTEEEPAGTDRQSPQGGDLDKHTPNPGDDDNVQPQKQPET